MALLYQFAASPYCEKARWALDHKGVDYQSVNLIPGPHRKVTRKIAKKTSVPILVDGAKIVQGSAEIISHLEISARHPPLTPTNSQDASMAHEWERFLDRNLGVPLRVYFYHYAFLDRASITAFLLHDGPWWGRMHYFFSFRGLKRAMKKTMGIDAAAAEAARDQLLVTFDRLDERLKDHKFLAGPQFSRADLTAAALLFHFWTDEWAMPAQITGLFDGQKERLFYQWAQNIYRDYRKQS